MKVLVFWLTYSTSAIQGKKGLACLSCVTDADNPRKKEPVLEIVVTLFKVYFELNTLRLCKNLSNAVDRLDFSIFPASTRVSYKFYMGRLSIFDNDYVRHAASLSSGSNSALA